MKSVYNGHTLYLKECSALPNCPILSISEQSNQIKATVAHISRHQSSSRFAKANCSIRTADLWCKAISLTTATKSGQNSDKNSKRDGKTTRYRIEKRKTSWLETRKKRTYPTAPMLKRQMHLLFLLLCPIKPTEACFSFRRPNAYGLYWWRNPPLHRCAHWETCFWGFVRLWCKSASRISRSKAIPNVSRITKLEPKHGLFNIIDIA